MEVRDAVDISRPGQLERLGIDPSSLSRRQSGKRGEGFHGLFKRHRKTRGAPLSAPVAPVANGHRQAGNETIALVREFRPIVGSHGIEDGSGYGALRALPANAPI